MKTLQRVRLCAPIAHRRIARSRRTCIVYGVEFVQKVHSIRAQRQQRRFAPCREQSWKPKPPSFLSACSLLPERSSAWGLGVLSAFIINVVGDYLHEFEATVGRM